MKSRNLGSEPHAYLYIICEVYGSAPPIPLLQAEEQLRSGIDFGNDKRDDLSHFSDQRGDVNKCPPVACWARIYVSRTGIWFVLLFAK